MPKLRESPTERMDRAFLAAIAAGQVLRREKNQDTLRLIGITRSTFYRKLKSPGLFSVEDARRIIQHYHFSDRQLCESFGVEYNGRTIP